MEIVTRRTPHLVLHPVSTTSFFWIAALFPGIRSLKTAGTSLTALLDASPTPLLLDAVPQYLVEILDQPFFEAVSRKPGDRQDSFPAEDRNVWRRGHYEEYTVIPKIAEENILEINSRMSS